MLRTTTSQVLHTFYFIYSSKDPDKMGLAVPIFQWRKPRPRQVTREKRQHLGLIPAAWLQGHILRHPFISSKLGS